ncbi:MAG: hypothetical protein EOP45_09770 [Sphingobacteriaceae bacterium]|nr:MAG: hypothetical protein EOP45_09770 [Sphingobacteriaceae bacterium]
MGKRIPLHTKEKLMNLCLEFSDIFHVGNDKSSVNNFYTQTLTVEDNTPVYTKNYRLPQTQKAEIDRQVKELLSNDLIE